MKNNIRKLRLSHNLTEQELGELIGKSQQSVSRLENGKRKIKIRELHILADYFNVSTDYLLARTDIVYDSFILDDYTDLINTIKKLIR